MSRARRDACAPGSGMAVVEAAEVDRAISFIAEQNGRTVDQLLVELDADGITPTQFRTSIEEQQLIRRLVDIVVNSRVNVSDTEVVMTLFGGKVVHAAQ